MTLLINTIKEKKYEETPIWIMRQAGRYLPEYINLRKNFTSFIDFCLDPIAASEVTIMPMKRFSFDAAIIFSDILILPHAFGVEVNFHDGIGPVIKSIKNVKDLKKSNQKILEKVYDAIKITKNLLEKNFQNKSLIGFAGAPWTVACYMIEGRGSKDFSEVRKFAYTNRQDFEDIINFITNETIKHLSNQIKSGANVIKIFDSWAGLLTNDLFEKFVIDQTKKIVSALKSEHSNIPIIGFARGAGVMHASYAKTGIDCIALDQMIDINWAVNNIDNKIAIQGNLDNALLFGSKSDIEKGAVRILKCFSDRRLVFNLGHGIMPNTPIDNVNHLIKVVKNHKYEK